MKILMEKQYSLRDIVQKMHPTWRADNIFAVKLSWWVKDLLDELVLLPTGQKLQPTAIKFADFDSDNTEFELKDYVDEMLDDLFNRFKRYYAITSEDDLETLSSEDFVEHPDVVEFWNKFFNVLNVTYPKYAPIIKAYKDNENKLMSSLNRDYTDDADSSGTVTSRYNDTPQDGGAFEDDNHTTNINESTSSSDSGLEHKEEFNNEYMIDRLNKIRDNLSNIFTEWENKVATILWR